MIVHCFILWVLLNSFPIRWSRGIFAMHYNMQSAWVPADWSTEKSRQETVITEESSGCLCRFKPDHHFECYGAKTCISFPKNLKLPKGVYDFRLKTTTVYKCYMGELSGFKQLKRLDIVANFRLNEIEAGFFTGMSNLVNLSISFNTELKFLHQDTFHGLNKLECLNLIKNGFTNILDASAALKRSLLPNIKIISLSENVFTEINETSFSYMNGTGLIELNLELCQIEKIHPKALKSFGKLEKLRIGENILDEEQLVVLFENMADIRTPISFLDLCQLGFRKGNKLTSLLNTVAKLNVTVLNLNRNHIESLYEGLFPPMPHLQTLDLREVSAITVEPNAFNHVLMPNLKTLLLSGNRLSGAMPGFLLPQLSELDLSANTGIDWLPSYFDVNSNIFENMPQLISLNISLNRIVTISNDTFNGVRHLKLLGLRNASIFYIAENSFRMLPNLFLLNLEDNPLNPFNTFPELIFQGLEKLEILLLSNCKITHFLRSDIFEPLAVLKYLNLRGNQIISINSNLFKPLHSLTGLDLSSNQLTPWYYPDSLFSFNAGLKVLLLSYNRFTYLTAAMMDDFSGVSRLDISSNPYVCDYILLETIYSWLLARNLLLKDTNFFDPSDTCLSPDKWRDKPISDFLMIGEIVDQHLPGPNTLEYVALAVAIVVIISALIGLSFCYRPYLRYWIFLAKTAYLRHSDKGLELSPIDYKYDAFVSYSHEDRNFVVGLVSKLENEEPYLKLCVYERDFEIGTVISETLMNKLNSSRKVLFVVSNSFAQSQWCIWELQLAEYNRINCTLGNGSGNPNDSLVIIKLGSIENCFLTPILKYMMRTRIYLEWSSDYKKQNIFWKKLKRSLIKNKGTENLDGSNVEHS